MSLYRKLADTPVPYLLRRVWKYSHDRRRLFIAHIAFTVIANVFTILEPLALAKAFNVTQLSSGDPDVLKHIIMYLLLYLALGFAFRIFFHISGIIERKNSFFVQMNFRQDLIDKTLALPASWHRDHHSADTIHKINRASESLESFSGNIYILIENVMRVAGAIIVLAYFDWVASAAAFIICICAALIIKFFDGRLRKEYRIGHDQENSLASTIQDSISNIVTVISLNLERLVGSKIKTQSIDMYPSHVRQVYLDANKWSLAKLMIKTLTTATVIVYAITSYKANGIVLAGTLFILYRYMSDMATIFNDSASRYSKLVREDVGVRGVEEIENAYQSLGPVINARLSSGWKEVQISRLSFSYSPRGSDQTAHAFSLSDISLSIRRGKKIAIIGESGIGKSTLLLILRGLYPAEAVVKEDGKNLPNGLSHLRPHITFIPQEPEIFDTTLENNITMGLSYPKEKIQRVLRMAHLEPVIDTLPKGLATKLMEKGVRLSGGQKQRVALARGFIASDESDIILLDEPTSSMDVLTEKKIYDNLFVMMPSKTVISTIHRLHLAPLFDEFYFFTADGIFFTDSFDTLLKNKAFAELWKSYHLSDKRNAI
ncbi:MAG: ABC transporter ATP-binding protein [Patescibacteria group bacterium]